jgi:hypothetical protein
MFIYSSCLDPFLFPSINLAPPIHAPFDSSDIACVCEPLRLIPHRLADQLLSAFECSSMPMNARIQLAKGPISFPAIRANQRECRTLVDFHPPSSFAHFHFATGPQASRLNASMPNSSNGSQFRNLYHFLSPLLSRTIPFSLFAIVKLCPSRYFRLPLGHACAIPVMLNRFESNNQTRHSTEQALRAVSMLKFQSSLATCF